MKEKTCCFTGHRLIPFGSVGRVKRKLKKEMIRLIENGVVRFISGGTVGFDMIAARTVLKLKRKYPHILLMMALPCQDQDKFWKYEDSGLYQAVLNEADSVLCLSDTYYTGCMHKRDRYMVQNSSYCIAYLIHTLGGTSYTVNYAQKQGLEVVILK